MADTSSSDYKILGCVLSDLLSNAAPLAVAMMAHDQTKAMLAGYVLSGLQNHAEQFPPIVHGAIENLISDLPHFRSGGQAEQFLLHLRTLGTGVVRLLKESPRYGANADKETRAFPNGAPHKIAEPASFSHF